ncbi:MAG: hypothetical protein SOT67_03550 [Bacteroidaceae bacterium]|nr:hypothetical protein [Bacteroidaceae bacterium]
MKKSESTTRKETPEEELKRLRKENRSLKSNLGKANDKLKRAKGELKQTKAELKKRRHEDNLEQRAERITFDAVPGHRYSLLVIKLCILIYTRTNCGLHTVEKIPEIFGEVFEGKCGKVPCYNTVENWMKKLGLSVYENDRTPCKEGKYAVVVDESIFVNSEKLLLLLGIPARHRGEPVKHEDVTVVGMKVSKAFDGDDINQEIEEAARKAGGSPEYVDIDQAHNLTNGVAKSGIAQRIDISHTMGTILKKSYGKQADFVAFTRLLGEVRLQYHLTDKAYLLPLNMRTIARFMNMSSWVGWRQHMLHAYSILPKEKQEAYSFVAENKELLDELAVATDAVRHVEEICKTKGFNIATCNECKHYIVKNVIGNANSRRAKLGIMMLDYFKKEEALLVDDVQNDNISSDIIESDYGIFKSKKSPNKLYGITPFVLLIPLYPKLVNKSVTDTFNFKERLVNVKLKDIDAWAAKNMSTNWVTERTKIFRKAN